MIVPLSEAVASRVPSLFNATQDRGARWASTTLTGCIVIASKITTEPLVTARCGAVGGTCDGGVIADGADLCGRG